ncbi:hypothetical protein Csa_006367 [Cucumis sativus]|uniref:Retrotransposon Copia-like N-terminal domain-containing protein n=1 Tax=Cucumis sativus TaxID=3659 RepID=A0A0A0LI19_CUCSA|nr:hypothetical protein Csa_006367 [Cucumis sativus]
MAKPTLHPNSSSSINQTTNFSTIEQYSNPYFLHHSNNTSIVLVSNLLTETNYASWSQAMKIRLIGKNKLGFTDDSITRPKTWLHLSDTLTLKTS